MINLYTYDIVSFTNGLFTVRRRILGLPGTSNYLTEHSGSSIGFIWCYNIKISWMQASAKSAKDMLDKYLARLEHQRKRVSKVYSIQSPDLATLIAEEKLSGRSK
jgi:hypothetical protein